MRLIIQRVTSASVTIDNQIVAATGRGYMALVGIKDGDDEATCAAMAKRLCKLRLFEDEAGKMNLSVEDIGGDLLLVPNFTVYADTSGGTRPSFSGAARPEVARQIFETLVEAARTQYTAGTVGSGVFQAHMDVSLVNDGPVTVILESK